MPGDVTQSRGPAEPPEVHVGRSCGHPKEASCARRAGSLKRGRSCPRFLMGSWLEQRFPPLTGSNSEIQLLSGGFYSYAQGEEGDSIY